MNIFDIKAIFAFNQIEQRQRGACGQRAKLVIEILLVSHPHKAFMLFYPCERYFTLIFRARWLLTTSSKLKSDPHNKADKDNAGISENGSGQCRLPNV